jgi:hypothetical protein
MDASAQATRDASPAVRPQATHARSLGRELSEIEALVVAAHFRTALALARASRPHASEGISSRERAQLDVLVATAEVALGHRSAAKAAMRRALAIEPTLVLARTVSPKVRAVFDEARGTPSQVQQ